jgi:hypothetical protein
VQDYFENSICQGQPKAQEMMEIKSVACQSWQTAHQFINSSAKESKPSISKCEASSSVFDYDNPNEAKQRETSV